MGVGYNDTSNSLIYLINLVVFANGGERGVIRGSVAMTGSGCGKVINIGIIYGI